MEESVGKWKKSNVNSVKEESGIMTDDQKLTKCQIEKKKIETQLFKM